MLAVVCLIGIVERYRRLNKPKQASPTKVWIGVGRAIGHNSDGHMDVS